jgi:KaiC/GvpD/RAD55 family RecA-like ATPase
VSDSTRKLPFDKVRQSAILWYLITDRGFFEHSKSRIEPGWFVDDRVGRVYKLLLDFAERTGRLPVWNGGKDVVEFKESTEILSEATETDRRAMRATIDKAALDADSYGLDLIRKDMTEWLRAAIFRGSVGESERLYNAGEFSKCYALLSDRIKEIQDARFEDDSSVSFKAPVSYLTQSESSYTNGCTAGMDLIDMALTPSGAPEQGGYYKGDTTIILAPANVGKTTILVTTAVQNVWKGKSVLFMTHEGRPEDIREKMLCCASGLDKTALFAAMKTQKGLDSINFIANVLEERILYVPYNKAGMTVEEVMPIIRRRQDEWAAKHGGQGFDMLVSDYPAKLSTDKAAHGHMQRRTIDEIVYECYVQLALELKLHSLLAIQTNREGSKVNRDKERLLTMEDVLESWGPMTAATNVITGNRSDVDSVKKRLTLYIAKSRSSHKGRAIVCRTNFAASQAFSNALGGCWYHGTSILGVEELDQYLVEYAGKALPDNVINAPPADKKKKE